MPDNETKSRKALRLKNYDYNSSGSYFITICVKNEKYVLSAISGKTDDYCVDDEIKVNLTEQGLVIKNIINQIDNLYLNIKVDRYVIMPDHIHLLITNNEEKEKVNISGYISRFKKMCSKTLGENIWQRSFYDHIIRDEEDYNNHCNYIDDNPKKYIMGKNSYYG